MFLAACGNNIDTANVVETSEKQEAAPVTAVSVDGVIVPIKNFNSQPTVLWFWAPNWGQCRSEAPAVAELEEIYGEEVQFIGVPSRGELKEVQEFISAYSVNGFPHIFDKNREIWSNYKIPSQPAWIFVDAAGNEEKVLGGLNPADLRSKISELGKSW